MTVKTRTGRFLLLAALCVSLLACKIVVVSGPSQVAVGDRVTYVLEISSVSAFGAGTPLYVAAEVPSGWQLETSTYEGTVGGLPVAGNALVIQSEECDLALNDVRPGFRRWYVKSPELPDGLTSSDTGEVTLEFVVGSQPVGQFELYFVLGAQGECSVPEVRTVNRQGSRLLSLIESFDYGLGGYDGPVGQGEVTPSPDGRHLYVATGDDRSVAALKRDGLDGRLTLIETESDAYGGVDALGPPVAARLSPDGQYLYVASAATSSTGPPSGITVFARDPTSGELTFAERVQDGFGTSGFPGGLGLAISLDGWYLYAGAASGISVYSRDETSGLLTLVDNFISPGGVLAISPDGRHLYATEDTVTAYSRDETTGELSFLDTGPSLLAVETAISPDGGHLYSVSVFPLSLVVQARDEMTGLVSPIQTIDVLDGLRNFYGASVAVIPNGAYVVASGHAGMTVFRRDVVTGELTFVENDFNGDHSFDDMAGLHALAFAPGGEHLYAVSLRDDALYGFETPVVIFHDGFESGTISAWSAAVP